MKYVYVVMKYSSAWETVEGFIDEETADDRCSELESKLGSNEEVSYKVERIVVSDLEDTQSNLKIILNWIDENWFWGIIILSCVIVPMVQLITGRK